LVELTREAHSGRRRLDGFLARLGREARAREQAGTGNKSASELMRSGGDVGAGEADTLAKRAGLGDVLPGLGEDLEQGKARAANADATARALGRLSDSEKAKLAESDREIAARAASLPPETFSRWLGRLVAKIKDPDQPSTAETEKARSELNFGRDRNGRWWFKGDLDAERGAAIAAAIRARASHLAGDDTPTTATRAQALYDLVCGQGTGMGVGSLGIGYVIDARALFDGPHDQTMAQTWAGDDHDPAAVRRLACDAEWWGVVINRAGTVTNLGRTRRRASRDQRLALRALYPGCPLDGSPFDQCEIHHLVPYEAGGSTDLDNLVPISQAWHHRIHDRGWKLVMNQDRSLDLYHPNGTHHRHIPTPQRKQPGRSGQARSPGG
jgi:hypothetical protein